MRVTLNAKNAGETVLETFNFTSQLSAAETIGTASVTATVYSGTDASPNSIVSGAAAISGQTVTQTVTGGTAGNVYLLLCTITTSSSQALTLSAFLPILPTST